MKRKKIISILLSLCISLSSMSIAAFGAEIDSENFEQAIVNVKSIVSISDDYKNFSHSARQINQGDDTITVWDLEWENDDEDNGGYISAEIDSYGNLCRYSSFKYDYDSSGLIKVSREKAENTAYEFLKKVLPDYCSDMKIVDRDYNDVYGDEYNFTYQQYVNNIPVDFVKVNIGVNKFTGELESYSGLEAGFKKMDYPNTEGIMDIEDAKSRYIDNIQGDFSYYSSYNYKEKNNKNFASYSVNNGKAVDAKSGDIVNTNNSKFDFYADKYSMGDIESAVDESGTAELSEAEKEEVNNISGLISKEKAQEVIKENIDLFSNRNIFDVVLNKNYISNMYIWEINFDNGYVEVNARTGEVIAFYLYDAVSGNGNNTFDEQAAKEKAENLLKRLAGNKFSQTRLNDEYSDPKGSLYEFNYIRQINGKNFMNNKLNVSIDKNTGNIVGYNSIWYDDANLPDVSQAISKTDAFNKFNDSESFGLHYVLNEKNTVELVYGFSEENFPYYIDALTGNKIDSMGNEYKSNKLPEYNDIQGHWCEKIVKELLDSGYYIPEDKFNPNTNISQINFFKYMLSRDMSDYSEDELYEILIDRGIVKKEERNASGPVTNKDAAKFITRYLGYDKLAQNSKIFNNVFKDSIDDDYLGYANICYGLNIIKGDSKGNFNENQCVNNAKAALYIYNIVSEGSNRYLK